MATELLASDVRPPRTVSSRGMMGMLKRLEVDSPGEYFFRLLPASSLNESVFREEFHSETGTKGVGGKGIGWSWLPDSARKSPTGLALLYTKVSDSSLFQPRLAIAPPFPIVLPFERTEVETTDRETLLKSINPPLHVAIILIRYGYVAVGIAYDEKLIITKTETRWVPNKHRAGGQSANRFKRSREKWAREFFDKAARLVVERFATYSHRIDYLIFGGDQHVINQFLQRANLPDRLSTRILGRRINTLRPNRNALKDAVRQAWSSTVYELDE